MSSSSSPTPTPTPLQRHVAFFDRNGDGIVYPSETYRGMRALGFSSLVSLAGSAFINLGLSYRTLETWIPNLLLPIHVKNIHKGKHGSDSGVYDGEGRFCEARFEQVFAEFAAHPQKMSGSELTRMIRQNRETCDISGSVAAWAEWKALYFLIKDEQGYATKEDIRAVYDGSLFEKIQQARSKPR